MTIQDKVVLLQELLEHDTDATDAVCSMYLSLAEQKILDRIWPFRTEEKEIPAKHDILHVELAQRLFLRRGAEGERIHIENGINHHYGSIDDEDLLSRLTPYVKVCR